MPKGSRRVKTSTQRGIREAERTFAATGRDCYGTRRTPRFKDPPSPPRFPQLPPPSNEPAIEQLRERFKQFSRMARLANQKNNAAWFPRCTHPSEPRPDKGCLSERVVTMFPEGSLGELTIKHQRRIGRYFVDAFIPSHQLAIQTEGISQRPRSYFQQRDLELARLGVSTFWIPVGICKERYEEIIFTAVRAALCRIDEFRAPKRAAVLTSAMTARTVHQRDASGLCEPAVDNAAAVAGRVAHSD